MTGRQLSPDGQPLPVVLRLVVLDPADLAALAATVDVLARLRRDLDDVVADALDLWAQPRPTGRRAPSTICTCSGSPVDQHALLSQGLHPDPDARLVTAWLVGANPAADLVYPDDPAIVADTVHPGAPVSVRGRMRGVQVLCAWVPDVRTGMVGAEGVNENRCG